MNRPLLSLARFVCLCCLCALCLPAWSAPEAGDAAPDFELSGSDGNIYKLSDFKGKKGVVIAFFPKAFTGG